MRKLLHLKMPVKNSIMGHIASLKSPLAHKILLKWASEHGNFYRIKIGFKNAAVISDDKAIMDILKQRPHIFRRNSKLANVFDEAGFDGIFTAEGERWKHYRKLSESIFHPNKMKAFSPIFELVTLRLYQHLANSAAENHSLLILDTFKRYTVDIISLLAFGEDINTLQNKNVEISEALHRVFPVIADRCRSPIPIWRFIKSKKDIEFNNDLSLIKNYLAVCIVRQHGRLNHYPALREEPENFLQVMLLEQESDPTLTDEDILANAVTMLLAGEDTTSNTLAWIAYLVSTSAETASLLEEECDHVLPIANTAPTWPIPATPVINNVIYESLRLKPTAPLLYLESNQSTVIGDIKIEKGTPIILLLHARGFNESVFKDSNKFVPDRWKKREHSLSDLFTFGGGPRLCPGRSLAMLEMRMACITLYRNFRLEPQQEEKEVTDYLAFTMKPNNFKVKLYQRTIVK